MPRNQSDRRSHMLGFTLLEMLATVTIIAVLAGFAAPAFGALLAGWQRDSAVKAFTAQLRLTRSSAIQSGHRTVMCISHDGATCTASTAKEWKHGWLTYVDLNANNVLDAGEPVVKVGSVQNGITSLISNNQVSRFVFKPNGLMSAGMCSVMATPKQGQARKITISRAGRVRLSTEK